MELREQMTPEGLEKYLLLDGGVVSLEELRGMVCEPAETSSDESSLNKEQPYISSMESPDPSRIRLRSQQMRLESPILRVVHVRSAS
jgi:hypothetical protein